MGETCHSVRPARRGRDRRPLATAKFDTAKCIAIFWCLYAFIASGFEHPVANMTLFSIALMADHPASVTVGGMGWNLLWVTIGNIIGGAGIMGLGYWLASRGTAANEPARRLAAAE